MLSIKPERDFGSLIPVYYNITNIIKSTANTHDYIEDKSLIWEIIKFEIRNYTIIYSSQKKRNKTVS